MDLDLLGIRTNAADEKARACKILSVFVDDLHAALLPWLPQIMHTLIPLLNTAPFDDMKLAALATMPELLVALASSIASPAGGADYRSSFLFILDTLLTFISEETELDLLIPALQTLNICLEKSVLALEGQKVPILQGAELARTCEVLEQTLRGSFERRAVRSAELEQEAWDEEEIEEYREMEHNENTAHLLIARNVGAVLQTHSQLALPLVHEILLEDLLECSDESRTAGDKLVGLFVMAKIVEFCGKEAFQYYPQFIPIFLRELHSADADIREVAAEAIGMATTIGKDLVCEIAPRCVKEIECTLEDPVSREKCYSKSNAVDVVVLGKVCFYLGGYLIMLGDHFAFWLNHLPIPDYEESNAECMRLLCGLLERGESSLVGEANQNIPRILQILCNSIGVVNDGELEKRMLRLVKTIEMQSTPQLMNALWEVLGAEKSDAVKRKLSEIQNLI